MDEPTRGPRLTLADASRRFGDVIAVRNMTVSLEPGRIHGLIGENGAGKSTALKMMAGQLEPSTGRVLVDGDVLAPHNAQEAFARGIGMVHQHFMLVDTFTAIENLVLGSEPVVSGRLDLGSARRRAEQIAEETGLHVDLDAITEHLAVGERQRLEILRVLYRGARALLLDEPTAVLSPVEVDELYKTLRSLADDGATIAVVTHRLDEVVRYCDEVTVMRRGERVMSEKLPEDGGAALQDRLTTAVMGREAPSAASPPALAETSEVVLAIEALRVSRPDGRAALDGIDLQVRAGEVIGVAGIEGNGQSELSRALAGLEPLSGGRVVLNGEPLHVPSKRPGRLLPERGHDVVRARDRGLIVVHEDRHRDEMVMGATIADNLVLGDLGHVAEERAAKERLDRFDVQPADPRRLGSELSGGNQQKVVMARALDRELVALVLAQPTRGVDVGTARTIHRAVAVAAESGTAVILISADLNELRSLSHRIVVLRRGQLVAELPPEASDDEIGRAMLGGEAA